MPKVLLEVSIITEEPRLALTCNVEQHPVSLFGITNTHSSGGAATASITNHQHYQPSMLLSNSKY